MMATMKKTALALRHLSFEDLGLLEPLLSERGFDVRYHEAGIDEFADIQLSAVDLLVVLGGPIGAADEVNYPWLADEVALVQRRLDSGRPLLGICLGAQLMARALGAEVRPMGIKEIGFAPLTLTDAGRGTPLDALGRQPVLHWHGDQFSMPAGMVSLAQTHNCPHQAFAPHSRALALQFHCELDPARIEQWLIGHGDELVAEGIRPQSLREAAEQQGPGLAAASRRFMSCWLDQALL